MTSMRTNFPILRATLLDSIPWAFIAPHERQADRNHGQTLQRLAERGGLSAREAMAVLEDRRYALGSSTTQDEFELINAVRAWRAAQRNAPTEDLTR